MFKAHKMRCLRREQENLVKCRVDFYLFSIVLCVNSLSFRFVAFSPVFFFIFFLVE